VTRPTPTRIAREAKGLAARDVAGWLGISLAGFTRAEARNDFTWSQAVRLAMLLGGGPLRYTPMALSEETRR